MKHCGSHILLALVVVACLVAGCAKAPSRARDQRCCPCKAGQQLDERLMATLASARAHHHQADIYQRQGQADQAMAAVKKILALDLDSRYPEAEEVRLDAAARLAKMMLSREDADQALGLVDGQIKGAQRESFYLSNLHSVRGEILEFQAKALDKAGDKDRAKEVSREAIAAFERSIVINKKLQQRLLKKEKR